MRVIYFTNDPHQKISIVPETFQYDHLGPLPSGFGLNNCWNYRLEGTKLVNTELNSRSTEITLFESNRIETLKLLKNKKDKSLADVIQPGDVVVRERVVREMSMPDNDHTWLAHYSQVQGQTLDQVKAEWKAKLQLQEQQVLNVYLNVRKFEVAVENCTEVDEILAIHDQIVKADLTAAIL